MGSRGRFGRGTEGDPGTPWSRGFDGCSGEPDDGGGAGPANLDRKITRTNTSREPGGGVASGAPHGAERTARRRHALSESQIA